LGFKLHHRIERAANDSKHRIRNIHLLRILGGLAAIWGYFLVPETSKLTLEQIDTLFKDGTVEEESVIKAQVAQDLRP
jgi:hypothetical protein